jgi:hypothetical protein
MIYFGRMMIQETRILHFGARDDAGRKWWFDKGKRTMPIWGIQLWLLPILAMASSLDGDGRREPSKLSCILYVRQR